ncbi:DNA endonuclease IV [Serratia phage PS2]|uniref:DNA endonuclease IV n=1 Tax=Serratia phage PS2 TaxID=1481112 RepID=A0A023W590_9CAUD|nr:DenB-like DNA endonuclease IV [Serratia phage PS2]AHY25509.1 DNA endonuclease IV [Serratia phage PS2]
MKPAVMKSNPGFDRLSALRPWSMRISDVDGRVLNKIRTTVEYAQSKSPNDSKEDVIARCARAILAEAYIAQWMEGQFAYGEEDLNDPYTWGYDVLAHQKYCGLRIEVKTTTSQKSISCSTGQVPPYATSGMKGVSFAGTMMHEIADVVIVVRVSVEDGLFTFTPAFLFTPDVLGTNVGFVRRSKFSGFYLANYFDNSENYSIKVF